MPESIQARMPGHGRAGCRALVADSPGQTSRKEAMDYIETGRPKGKVVVKLG